MSNEIENNKKKKLLKRSELVALEIDEKQAEFDKLIEEHKKILELTQREYSNTVKSAEKRLSMTRKDIILEAGKYLENNLDIVNNNSPDQICRMLKQKFKGLISIRTIQFNCPEKWKAADKVGYGKSRHPSKEDRSNDGTILTSKEEESSLTEYEQKYVEIHEQKVNRNKNITALIDDFLGMTEEEKTILFGKLKKRGSEFNNALIDEAYHNMLKIVKSLNDVDIPALLADIRFLKQILTKVADIALEEHEQRKRSKEISGQ